MNIIVEMTGEMIDTIKTSLKYSKDRIRNAPDTPYELRQANLARIDDALAAIRTAAGTSKD